MDTSREYIKMCAALPEEFWDKFNPDTFNAYAVFHGNDFRGLLHEQGVRHTLLSKGISPVQLKYADVKAWYAKPLPRLDQLLEIVRGDSLHIHILLRFNTFADTRSRQDHGWGLKFPTLEQMALSFVMHEIHGMTWTGESWEPERTDREEDLQKQFEEEDGQ